MVKFEAPGIKVYTTVGIFGKFRGVAGEQGLALQQFFSVQIFLLLKNSDCHKFSFFNEGVCVCVYVGGGGEGGGSNLAILVFSMRSFHFWHSSNDSPYYNNFLGKM